MFLFALSALIGLTSGQFHDIPSVPAPVVCYDCDNTNHHNFPLCLGHPVTCYPGDVCQIDYGPGTPGHIPDIQCRTPAQCSRWIQGHHQKCESGGVHVARGVCQACCDTSECVSNLTSVLRLEIMASQNLFCPGRCNVNHLSQCIDTGRVCEPWDFCKVRIDHSHRVTGHCTDVHLWGNCNQQLQDSPCPRNFTDSASYTHVNQVHCTHDCCLKNDCLFTHFGIHMANASIPTDPNRPISNGNGSSLWEQLRGSCQDNLEQTMCQSLKNEHDVCHSRLSLSMCPETCGLCSAINSSVCRDTTDECADFILTDDSFCTTDAALFSCPDSCQVCDKLIDSIVTSIISGTSTGLPSDKPPMGASTPIATVDCMDLETAECVHLSPLCSSSFLKVVCPEQCERCLSKENLYSHAES